MKTKSFSFLVLIISLGLLAAYGTNRIFTSATTKKSDVSVNLLAISYTDDHIMVEYTVDGLIETPEGTLVECPVGEVSVLNNKSNKINGLESDFIYCRPNGNSSFLVTQFFYNDFSVEENKPQKIKIKIGDVDSTTMNGKVVHIAPIGDYYFDLPLQTDAESTSYPEELAEAVSGLKMKIKRVDFSPSMAKVDACLTLPDTGDWVFDAYLLVGDQKFPFEYWGIPNFRKQGILDTRERCYFVIVTNIPDYKTFRKGDVSFVIEKVLRNIGECTNQEGYLKIQDELKSYGVAPIEPDALGNYCFAYQVTSLADPGAIAHLNNYIHEALKEEVEGPLLITVK